MLKRIIYLFVFLIFSFNCSSLIKKDKINITNHYSLIGQAKIKLYQDNELRSCKMLFCFQRSRAKFFSEFLGPFSNKLGYFILDYDKIFFSIKNLNSYLEAKADKFNFSHILGIEIEPINFFNLLEGEFNYRDFTFYKQEIINESINNYFYSDTHNVIVEVLNKEGKRREKLFFYDENKLYSSISFKYDASTKLIKEISIQIVPINSFIVIEIEKQNRDNIKDCSLPPSKFLKKGNKLNINDYNRNYPLIFDLIKQ